MIILKRKLRAESYVVEGGVRCRRVNNSVSWKTVVALLESAPRSLPECKYYSLMLLEPENSIWGSQSGEIWLQRRVYNWPLFPQKNGFSFSESSNRTTAICFYQSLYLLPWQIVYLYVNIIIGQCSSDKIKHVLEIDFLENFELAAACSIHH